MRSRAIAALIVCLTGAAAARTPPAITLTTRARALQPGELVVVTIASTEAPASVHATAFGHALTPYRVDDRTWRVLVGIDLDVTPGTYRVVVDAAGAPQTSTPLHVVAKAFPTRHLTVDESFVNPPPDAQTQIAADVAALNAIWAKPDPTRLWTTFVPAVSEPANSAFGTRSVFNGQPRSPHGGADFPSPAGTAVHAPAAGHVVLARSLYYTGNTVVIDHGLGLFSMLCHFSEIAVHDGDLVTAGQVVGKVGATGRVTGPHLHWAVRLNGARVDPMALLALLGQ
jgi:murein DD-endopeptidase MepM/ murein hydrolase activator NlpD